MTAPEFWVLRQSLASPAHPRATPGQPMNTGWSFGLETRSTPGTAQDGPQERQGALRSAIQALGFVCGALKPEPPFLGPLAASYALFSSIALRIASVSAASCGSHLTVASPKGAHDRRGWEQRTGCGRRRAGRGTSPA
jgi:hypothetical protein